MFERAAAFMMTCVMNPSVAFEVRFRLDRVHTFVFCCRYGTSSQAFAPDFETDAVSKQHVDLFQRFTLRLRIEKILRPSKTINTITETYQIVGKCDIFIWKEQVKRTMMGTKEKLKLMKIR